MHVTSLARHIVVVFGSSTGGIAAPSPSEDFQHLLLKEMIQAAASKKKFKKEEKVEVKKEEEKEMTKDYVSELLKSVKEETKDEKAMKEASGTLPKNEICSRIIVGLKEVRAKREKEMREKMEGLKKVGLEEGRAKKEMREKEMREKKEGLKKKRREIIMEKEAKEEVRAQRVEVKKEEGMKPEGEGEKKERRRKRRRKERKPSGQGQEGSGQAVKEKKEAAKVKKEREDAVALSDPYLAPVVNMSPWALLDEPCSEDIPMEDGEEDEELDVGPDEDRSSFRRQKRGL